MTSVQERLKLKRVQIDTWSIKEQLCLASAVVRSGDQNWMSVSRSLKAFGDAGRPPDWFSQKSCAVQYSNLLENVETPKRKKRTDKGDTTVETPSESIVRRLTQERIEELKRLLNEDRLIYAKLKEEVMLVKSGYADDKLPEMCHEIEEEKKQKERKAEAHERWLKEREEKKIELERTWKPPVAPASPYKRKHHTKMHRRNSSQSEPSSEAESAVDSPINEPLNVDVIGEEPVQENVEPEPSQTPTSPLLTSLLKSPSPAPSSQGSSILHSAITAQRGVSPTITSLLSSAPGVPGTSNMGTVAPPTAVSSSLKNLVTSAISSEQPHHQPPPHNPSPAAGAPTLSMLLELPPSLPGKPLPELPSAVKSTTLPSSTVSAIVSTAIMASPSAPKIVSVRSGIPSVSSSESSKITSSLSICDNEEHQTPSQEIKIADSTSRDDEIEVLQVETSDAQESSIESKEELIEEVLIEEVVVNDDSVIESELLTSQISDVVVANEEVEEAKEKESKDGEETKLDETFMEVSQSSEVTHEVKTEMIAEVDSTSSNSGSSETVGISNNIEEKKEESMDTVIDTNSQEHVSEVETEEAAAVEVEPTSAAATSGDVADVIEITEDQETLQTEIVSECGPCMQELEDMEVIILDKVQGLEEVQIVEEMKELECEVVEVVMGTQEKVDDLKEDRGEGIHDTSKSEELNSDEPCSQIIDSPKNSEDVDSTSNIKSDTSTTEQEHAAVDTKEEKEENEIVSEDVQYVEEEETGENSSDITDIIVDSGEPREIIVEGPALEENENYVLEKGELIEDDKEEVASPETTVGLECESKVCVNQLEDKNSSEDSVCEVEKSYDLNEGEIKAQDVQNSSVGSSLEENNENNESVALSPEHEKEQLCKEHISEDESSEEILTAELKDPPLVKEKELIEEKDASEKNSSDNEIIKEIVEKDNTEKNDEKECVQVNIVVEHPEEINEKQTKVTIDDESSKDEVKVAIKDDSKRELTQTCETSKQPGKESVKKDEEESTEKQEDSSVSSTVANDVQANVNETGTSQETKEEKIDIVTKETNKKEVEIEKSKNSFQKDNEIDPDFKKSTVSKEFAKRDHLPPKKEIPTSKIDSHMSKKDPNVSKKDTSRKDLPVNKKEVPKKDLQEKEIGRRRLEKETKPTREHSRKDNKEDIVKKEVSRRSSVKERKEFPKDEVKKRPQREVSKEKEFSKTLKKTDVEVRSLDVMKREPSSKAEKIKKETETNKEEIKENKKERVSKDNQEKREEDTTKDIPLKELTKGVGHSKIKSSVEDSSKTVHDKKDGKEQPKMTNKNEITSKPESNDDSEEKSEKRLQLRSATPSTEDDKTNDADTPKVVGRKRLAAVSAMDSVPNSPASITTDEEREYKSWKKSIMLLYGRLATHKYASLFLRPITDDQAPGYSSIVHRPIDLLTIKKNIETGVIRTTAEFQRDVLLMFLNSIMYNKSNHFVHKMAKQMQQEGMQHIQDYLATQMLVQVVGDGVPTRRETRTTEANKQRDFLGNPSNATALDENESISLHKRKRNTASDSSDRGLKKKKVDE